LFVFIYQATKQVVNAKQDLSYQRKKFLSVKKKKEKMEDGLVKTQFSKKVEGPINLFSLEILYIIFMS